MMSLKIAIHVLPDTSNIEECIFHIEHLYEQQIEFLTENEAHKARVKNQYEKSVKPRVFSKGELVLLWYQDKEPFGGRKIWVYVVRTICHVKSTEERGI